MLPWKTINSTYSACVCVCVCFSTRISYPACRSRIFCAVLYCQLWPFWLYHVFPHYLINEKISRKKKLFENKCVIWFRLKYFFFWKITPSKKNSTRYYHKCTVYRSSCKVSSIPFRFQPNVNFLERFSKNPQILNVIKIHWISHTN